MTNRVLFLTVLVVVACIAVFVIGSLNATPASRSVPLDVTLHAPGVSATQPMLFAANEAAFWRIVKAKNASDPDGYMDELKTGGAFLVKNGTRVRIIDKAVGMRRCRVLEGANEGQAGWVPTEWVE